MVLAGHPGGLHKKARGLVARALHSVAANGFHVASIDAPGHGDRPRNAQDQHWVAEFLQASAIGIPLTAVEPRITAAIFGGVFVYEA